MKRTKKILVGFLAALSVFCGSLGLAACGGDSSSSSGEATEIEKVYAQYVVYAQAEGQTPLSYEEWLATIKGEKGEKGEKGDTGAQGEKGEKGDTGAQGEKGDKGDTGAQGAQGEVGPQGPQGEQGLGIEKVEYDENGDLKITFTDGTKQTVDMPKTESSGSNSLIDKGATENLHYQKIAGKEEYRVVGLGLATETDIVISSTYKGLPVTEIAEYAFGSYYDYENNNLTSITIPASVTSIGYEAFYSCYSLTNVYINDIEAWCDISFGSYGANPLCYGGNLYLNSELVTELEIPESIASIGNYAFYNCDSLTSITIPDSVTSIGESAFRDCSGLIYCELESLPSDWNEYWNGSCPIVWDCKNNDVATDGYIYIMLDGIRYGLKDGVATVRMQANHITTANISASVTHKGAEYPVTSISSSAFWICSSLTSVVIPDGVISIGYNAFAGCSGLTSITFNGTKAQWNEIKKGDNWKDEVPATKVVCSDGEVAL